MALKGLCAVLLLLGPGLAWAELADDAGAAGAGMAVAAPVPRQHGPEWDRAQEWEARAQALMAKERADETLLLDRTEAQQRMFEQNMQNITQEVEYLMENHDEMEKALLQSKVDRQLALLASWEEASLDEVSKLQAAYKYTRRHEVSDEGDSEEDKASPRINRLVESALNDMYIAIQKVLRIQRADQEKMFNEWRGELDFRLKEYRHIREESLGKVATLSATVRKYQNTARNAQLNMALIWQEAHLKVLRQEISDMIELINKTCGRHN